MFYGVDPMESDGTEELGKRPGAHGEGKTLPVISERLSVTKDVVENKIRITKAVSESVQDIRIPFSEEHYDIERIEVNQYVDGPPPELHYENETMVIPVIVEEVVVQKRLKLVEEIRITKTTKEKQFESQETLRKEQIDIVRE